MVDKRIQENQMENGKPIAPEKQLGWLGKKYEEMLGA